MINMVVLGPPGSGKDTQIDELVKFMDLQLISGGDIARTLASKSAKYKKIVDEGGLIDDSVITKEIDKMLSEAPVDKGIVFDGFPRTLRQAEVLGEVLLHHGRNLDVVIYIDLDEKCIVNRLSKRRVCSICGHNVCNGSEQCHDCGGGAVRRVDDEPAVIIKRVQTFLENTLPLVNYYRNKGIILEIDGDQSIKAVASDIKVKLGDVTK